MTDSHTQPLNILRLDSSARYGDSVSRQLTDRLLARLRREYPEATATTRDLTVGVPLPTEAFTDGIVYAAQDPTPAMQVATQRSDELVAELLAADLVVLGLPVYNWTIPSTFKAYVDQVVRPGVTFEYIDGVRHGKLRARRIYIVFASGGTGLGSPQDFATPYLRFLWQTLGIPYVEFIEATDLLFTAAESTRHAEAQIEQLALPVLSLG